MDIAQAESTLLGGSIEVELRTVNHRFLEVRVRTPRELHDAVPFIEQLARESLSRGRVDVVLRAELPIATRPVLDRARAKAAYAELAALRDEVAPSEPVPLSLLSAVPDLFAPALSSHAESSIRSAVRQAFGAAVAALNQSREDEGAALGADLAQRVAHIETLCDAIALRSPALVELQKKRLHERAERLRGALDVPVDEARLEAEIVVFADRIDVTEEIVRLRLHAAQMQRLLSNPGGGQVGRRLEFLLQEMLREANTTSAKSADAQVSHAVVDIKGEIERMREQVANVE